MTITAIGTGSSAWGGVAKVPTRATIATFAPAATDVAATATASDFGSMTPDELAAQGKAMYARGTITLDQLFKFEVHSGTFGAAERGEREAQAPTDWHRYFATQLDGAISRGHADGASAYRAILDLMR